MNVTRSNIVAALTLMLSTGLFAAVLAMSTANANGATSVGGQSSARKFPQLVLSLPATVTPSSRPSPRAQAARLYSLALAGSGLVSV